MSHYFINDNNLVSEIKPFSLSVNNIFFQFNTDNGVFSKGELDFGTRLLIENVIKMDIHGDVLDLGCGYGPIGIIIKKFFNVNMTLSDVNNRAIHLSKMNIKKNNVVANVINSDGYENIVDTFDYIISNPPIRIGKKKLYELLLESKKHLKENGEMIIVVRKEQGALSLIKDMGLYFKTQILDKQKGFLIISLKND
ncbi:MAG: class I SAM-dependent methyltransferase [Bacilli bacterium]|nr:class I SAM-dependent methyltransferase [Bacilli bacterium]